MTIKQVAEYANVSVATVSRVLNGDPKVKGVTCDAVKKAIKETGYVANAVGRNLRTAQSNVILVILPMIQNPFYGNIVRGIEEYCRNLRYNVLICNVYERHDLVTYYCEYIDKKLVDGIIFVSPVWKRDYSFIKDKPVVSCFESDPAMPVPQIDIDNVQAAREAVEYLISLGAKDIALVGGGSYSPSSFKRKRGYLDALAAHGLPVDPDVMLEGYFTYADGMRAAETLFARRKPDAIFADSDEVGVACINAARDHGYRVPDNLLVMGFDNVSFSEFSRPALTTVDQPRYDIGAYAAEQLIARIEGKPVGDKIFPHKIVIRGSTEKGGTV